MSGSDVDDVLGMSQWREVAGMVRQVVVAARARVGAVEAARRAEEVRQFEAEKFSFEQARRIFDRADRPGWVDSAGPGEVAFVGALASHWATRPVPGLGVPDAQVVRLAGQLQARLEKLTAGVGDGLSLDSDGDGLPDVVERELGLNPYAADSDGDGLSDGREYAAGAPLDDIRARPIVEPSPSLTRPPVAAIIQATTATTQLSMGQRATGGMALEASQ